MTHTADTFAPLNAFFDHIYVLTLDRATERQENIKKELEGLNWSFFQATDKLNLSMDALIAEGIYDDVLHRNTKRTHRSMNLGEVACSLSHVRMYQHMLDNNFKRVLILEDDVLPQHENLKGFDNLVAQLPEDWELLMLGYYGHKLPTSFYRLQQQLYFAFHKLHLFNWHQVSEQWIKNICMKDFSPDLFQIGKVLGTHAYAITDTVARKFIDFQNPVHLQADRIFNYYMADKPLKAFAPKDTLFTLSELAKVSSIQ